MLCQKRGAILADDMALGKTVQAIAMLLSEREVIFLFEGTQLDETMQRLLREAILAGASGCATPSMSCSAEATRS